MMRMMAVAAMLAGISLIAVTIPAQATATTVTTNTYDAKSTSDDIRASCKEVSVSSTGTLSAKCNKKPPASSPGRDPEVVSTTINMLTYVNCRTRGTSVRVRWGAAETGLTLVDPHVLLTSNGKTYIFGGYCEDSDGDKVGPSGVDFGHTTDGLKNNDGSLEKR